MMKIATSNLILVKLMWVKADGEDPNQIKKYRACMAAAKRCLQEHAPLLLGNTGFNVCHVSRWDEMRECIEGILAEQELDITNVLVSLSAPEDDVHSRDQYHAATVAAQLATAVSIQSLISRLEKSTTNVRSFNGTFRAMDTLLELFEEPPVKLRAALVKIEQMDPDMDRLKMIHFLKKISKSVGAL